MTRHPKKVVVYTTQSCPYCRAAKELLNKRSIAFTEIDVTGDADARERLVEMSGGRMTVPQIFVDGKAIGGYDDLVADLTGFLAEEGAFRAL
jgi:glutaredoxin 3